MNDLPTKKIRVDLLPLPYHVRFAATQRLQAGQSVDEVSKVLGVSVAAIEHITEGTRHEL